MSLKYPLTSFNIKIPNSIMQTRHNQIERQMSEKPYKELLHQTNKIFIISVFTSAYTFNACIESSWAIPHYSARRHTCTKCTYTIILYFQHCNSSKANKTRLYKTILIKNCFTRCQINKQNYCRNFLYFSIYLDILCLDIHSQLDT